MKARIGMENENIFTEEFWENQNFIINAVDNLDARLYISEQCLLFRKILIDSGTLGIIANSPNFSKNPKTSNTRNLLFSNNFIFDNSL